MLSILCAHARVENLVRLEYAMGPSSSSSSSSSSASSSTIGGLDLVVRFLLLLLLVLLLVAVVANRLPTTGVGIRLFVVVYKLMIIEIN